MALIDSASSGDRLSTLRDLRDVLASNIDSCESLRDLSSLAARLQSVLEEIDKLEGPKETGDGIDEIAQRRAARGAVAAPRPVRTRRGS